MSDAVMQVGHVTVDELAHGLEFDVLRRQVVEQSPALAEQDVDDVQLQLVEQPRTEQGLRCAGAVDHDVAVTRGRFRQGRALGDIGDEPGAARRYVVSVDVVGEDEDRNPVVVVALPAAGML